MEGDQNVKVLYELDLNDIIRIVAEKYGVPQEKVKKTNKDGLNYLMIDMSTTETPGPVPFKDYVSPFLAGKKEAPAEEQKGLVEEKKGLLGLKKGPEQQEPEPTDEELQELKYKLITDEKLISCIKNDMTVPDICEEFCLKDKKYAQRLYKKIGNLKAEMKAPTTEEQKAILKSLKKAQAKRTEPGIDGDITIYTCPVCGKEFDTEKYPQYAYKKQAFNHKHIFCGYDCMRKAEKALTPEG
jgi:uncharacterized protein (UPF0212 family)